jgi:branched-chain amino acid transport system permease protein
VSHDANIPDPPDAVDRPRVGVDEWVAQVEARSERGVLGVLRQRFYAVPGAIRLAALVIPAAFIPAIIDDQYLMQVAIDTTLFVLLALGLNIAVGWAGLLDLGYVAFFGFGAYAYTLLASGHTGVHWQAATAIPVVVAASAVFGFLLGLPSWRLVGDYLAIVTLFFFQIFLTILINATAIDFPFVDRPLNVTRGPNGISSVDPLDFFGWDVTTLDEYFWLALGAFVLIIGALYLLNESRTGRAWRALREDPLAAELMSMPVNRLKLVAFSIGAAVAGLTGSIFAAEQGSVFPQNFDLALLITLYAMVILGGVGSLAGVAIGAIVINVALEVLRTPANASWLFFVGIALAFPVLVRSWRLRGVVAAAVVGFGFAVHELVEAVWPRGVSGSTEGEAWIDGVLDAWVLLPANPVDVGKWGYVLLIAAVLGLTLLRAVWRAVALVPVLYLAACVWENVLVVQPAVARYIMLGGMLVALMAARPQGLLGTTRVEIV